MRITFPQSLSLIIAFVTLTIAQIQCQGRDDESTFTDGNIQYQIRCNTDVAVNNLNVISTNDFGACAAACDKWTRQNPDNPCFAGVVNSAINTGGGDFCSLKGSAGTNDDANFDAIIRLTARCGGFDDRSTFFEGLVQYQVQCNTDRAANDLASAPSTGLSDCAAQCDDYTSANPDTPCLAAVVLSQSFVDTGYSQTCFLKDGIGLDVDTNDRDSIIRLSSYPETCRGRNNGSTISDGNIDYQLVCNSDFRSGNLKQTSATTYEECAADCDAFSASNPSYPCRGTSFTSEFAVAGGGTLQCYLKGESQGSGSPVDYNNGYDALIRASPFPKTCFGLVDGNTFTEGYNTYQVSCDTDLQTFDLNGLSTAPDLQGCADQCNAFDGCVAVVLGNEVPPSCHLKGSLDGLVSSSSYNIAILIASNRPSSISETSSSTLSFFSVIPSLGFPNTTIPTTGGIFPNVTSISNAASATPRPSGVNSTTTPTGGVYTNTTNILNSTISISIGTLPIGTAPTVTVSITSGLFPNVTNTLNSTSSRTRSTASSGTELSVSSSTTGLFTNTTSTLSFTPNSPETTVLNMTATIPFPSFTNTTSLLNITSVVPTTIASNTSTTTSIPSLTNTTSLINIIPVTPSITASNTTTTPSTALFTNTTSLLNTTSVALTMTALNTTTTISTPSFMSVTSLLSIPSITPSMSASNTTLSLATTSVSNATRISNTATGTSGFVTNTSITTTSSGSTTQSSVDTTSIVITPGDTATTTTTSLPSMLYTNTTISARTTITTTLSTLSEPSTPTETTTTTTTSSEQSTSTESTTVRGTSSSISVTVASSIEQPPSQIPTSLGPTSSTNTATSSGTSINMSSTTSENPPTVAISTPTSVYSAIPSEINSASLSSVDSGTPTASVTASTRLTDVSEVTSSGLVTSVETTETSAESAVPLTLSKPTSSLTLRSESTPRSIESGTATSVSTNPSSVSTSGALPTGTSPRFSIRGLFRNGTPGVVAVDGRLVTNYSLAAVYEVSSAELFIYTDTASPLIRRALGGRIATNANVNSAIFTPDASSAAISTTFVFSGLGQYIAWNNASFLPDERASFCVYEGFVYAVLKGDLSFCEYTTPLIAIEPPDEQATSTASAAQVSTTGPSEISSASASVLEYAVTTSSVSSPTPSSLVSMASKSNTTIYNGIEYSFNIDIDIEFDRCGCNYISKDADSFYAKPCSSCPVICVRKTDLTFAQAPCSSCPPEILKLDATSKIPPHSDSGNMTYGSAICVSCGDAPAAVQELTMVNVPCPLCPTRITALLCPSTALSSVKLAATASGLSAAQHAASQALDAVTVTQAAQPKGAGAIISPLAPSTVVNVPCSTCPAGLLAATLPQVAGRPARASQAGPPIQGVPAIAPLSLGAAPSPVSPAAKSPPTGHPTLFKGDAPGGVAPAMNA